MNRQLAVAERIEHWPTDRLKPYARNARTHSPEQVDKIAASIVEFGFTNPILVDSDDGIIAGHGRLMAAIKLAMETVPVVVLDHLTDAQRRAYIIADNRLALDAGWDEALLAAELADLQAEDFDLALTGFEADEIDDLLSFEDEDEVGNSEPSAGPDDVPEFTVVPTSVEGDLWRLGNHRVLCGDSTCGQATALLLDGGLADCLWTDPPYNVNYEGSAGKILNDHMEADAFGEFLQAVYQNAIQHMAPGAPAYIAHADTEGTAFRREFEAAGFYLASCLIWRKNSLVLGRADYHWQHEPILYGWKPGAAHRWYGERNKTTLLEQGESPITRMSDTEVQITLGELTVVVRGAGLSIEQLSGSVFFEDKPKRNSEHPTMKPVGLIERMLENSTNPGDTVLDLFGGSGSTLIACEKLRRHARLMELDPKFVDVIVKRWEEFTGRKARLDSTGQTFAEVEAERRRGVVPAPARQAAPAAPVPFGFMSAGRPFTERPAANDDGTAVASVA